MNERIRELAEKCWVDDECGYGCGRTQEFDQEKFAELIVKECCEVAHCNFHVDGLTLGQILREHFGVEE